MSLALASRKAALLAPRIRDPDALAYIAAVEAADGQALEPAIKRAIDTFVLGCRADGTWNAIKASCILAGARTLSGALVPLAGTAPTNFNFVSGDYDRKTGLVGDGSTKYLNSNRDNNADPQDNHHLSVYVTTTPSIGNSYIGCSVNPPSNIGTTFTRSRSDIAVSAVNVSGFIGISRSLSSSYIARRNQVDAIPAVISSTPLTGINAVFARGGASGATIHSNARIAFYSIGESLDLALLDARVTDLINAFGAAIP